jgi:hypothetical protein
MTEKNTLTYDVHVDQRRIRYVGKHDPKAGRIKVVVKEQRTGEKKWETTGSASFKVPLLTMTPHPTTIFNALIEKIRALQENIQKKEGRA